MIWIFEFFVLVYIIVSSIALVVYAYKRFLQYLTPLKGYVVSLLLILTLVSFDFVVFNFTNQKIDDLKNQQETVDMTYWN
ncbi:hypothetical protein [Flexithrix dorotheae]|uniref:hypothetical protein n=1 Tax=Flexithrix dorotheae TaxID=70993 RepID=UPI00036DB2C9|nr:hypothetical protein [Flexithrix dorotheae]